MKLMVKIVACMAVMGCPNLQAQKRPAPLPPIPTSVTFAPANPQLPAIFAVGDSTATRWGPQIAELFDPAKVNLILAAAAGRSTRSYRNEGIWARVLAKVRPNDIVIIELGGNDGLPLDEPERWRGTLRGIGDETQDVYNTLIHEQEVVHTYGWYLRQYVRETKAKGAKPILLSVTPRDTWIGGHMETTVSGYPKFAREVASQEHCDFADVTAIAIAGYELIGEEKTQTLFEADKAWHVTELGAKLNAEWIVQGLKGLPDAPITAFLSPKGQALAPVATP